MHSNQRILRRKSVLSETGFTSSSLNRAIQSGLFPTPIRLSPEPSRRAVGWPEREVIQVNEARIAGFSTEATRELVQSLIQQRQEGANNE